MRIRHRIPNFHNFGINLRILLMVNLLPVIIAIIETNSWANFFNNMATSTAAIQPVLMLTLGLCYLFYSFFMRISYKNAVICIFATVLLSCICVKVLSVSLLGLELSLSRFIILAFIVTAMTLYYFDLHHRAYSPAITEARLQALQARIRPHFLFNSINAVLSLIRNQPKRAEIALENMADLFRVLMADNSDLVAIEKEIALCKQYLALEKLRLDDRLNIDWQIENMPNDALIPPLLLQPPFRKRCLPRH